LSDVRHHDDSRHEGPPGDDRTDTVAVDVRAVTVIPRNAGELGGFLSLNLRLTRTLHVTRGVSVDATIEAFHVTDRDNVVTRNGNFGAGAYPASPASNLGQVTAVQTPRSLQVSTRVRF
jgi:hypothetical protein